MKLKTLIVIYVSILILGCMPANDKNGKINYYNLDQKTKTSFYLSDNLHEISGLAMNKEGSLFAHNDESGIIYQLDKKSGEIIKNFQIGRLGIEGDFEGLAIVNDKFYLVESSGGLYVFNEGKDLERVDFEFIDLPFSDKYEIEGLCYQSEENGLLIACKQYAGKENKGERAVFFFDLGKMEIELKPRWLIPLSALKKKFGIKDFFPSGIEVNPISGTIFIISARGRPSIIEIDVKGNLISGEELNSKNHIQPEGITFLSNGDMVIADEGKDGTAKLTIYAMLKDQD